NLGDAPTFDNRVKQKFRVVNTIVGNSFGRVPDLRDKGYAIENGHLSGTLFQGANPVKVFQAGKAGQGNGLSLAFRKKIALRSQPFNTPALPFHLVYGLFGARSPIACTTLPISRVSYPPSPSSSSRKFLLTIISRSLLKPGSAS